MLRFPLWLKIILLLIQAIFLCGFAMLCGSGGYRPAPGLVEFNPETGIFNNQYFPRVHGLIYRGLSAKEYSLEDSISAMLGNDLKIIRSKLLKLIELKCRNKSAELTITEQKETNTFLAKVSCAEIGKNGKSNYLAMAAAKFEEDKRSDAFQDRYLNYNSRNYQNYPANLIFGTAYVEAATFYENHIVAFAEDPYLPRALDLNYYNYAKNGDWLEPGLKSMNDLRDTGEIVVPVAIYADQIRSYEIRQKNFTENPLIRKINWAFYKTANKENPSVLIIDGKKSPGKHADAIKFDGDSYYYAQSMAYLTRIPPYPQRLPDKVKVYGVIVKDSGDASGSMIAKQELSKYKCSKRKLSREVALNMQRLIEKEPDIRLIACSKKA